MYILKAQQQFKSQNLRAFPVYFLPAQNIQFSTAASNPYPEEKTEKNKKQLTNPKRLAILIEVRQTQPTPLNRNKIIL
ncbi:MAG: hypothetical protein F6K62_09595 [Sphaerospermopsis sp. SIO1G2]|nr:hypothetical protein [Sphaerospermopsis sp. SIO1G2]